MHWTSPFQLDQATLAVKAGGVIAYPTEAVWGLGCNPFDRPAVEHLLQLKQRPMAKGLILVAADKKQFAPWLEGLSLSQQQQLDDTWPGPTTWLVPVSYARDLPWVTGSHGSIALRVSDHPLVQALCRRLGHPLVSTSANIAGRPAARFPWQVRRDFGASLDYILPGELGGRSKPSRICDLKSGAVLR